MRRKILLIGPVGSGKSTQSELLSQYLNLPIVSSSGVLREVAESNTEEGKRIKEIMTTGGLVDDETMARLIKDKAQNLNGFIMDGYPRTLKQIEIFDPKFEEAIYLELPDEVILERLSKRGRIDDKPEVIQNRLNFYRQYTQPILEYYKNLGILKTINGQGNPEQIQQKIRKQINEQD